MSSLSKVARTQISKSPEVLATVVTDRAGALLDSTGDIDGETVGAVYAVSIEALLRTGESLGLGLLQRASITGPKKACIIAVQDDEIFGVHLDPGKPLGAFEKKLEGALRQ
jgi:predicted regulator of Ras-like GTPase activity (Roadblock/LC7/MglB family)